MKPVIWSRIREMRGPKQGKPARLSEGSLRKLLLDPLPQKYPSDTVIAGLTQKLVSVQGDSVRRSFSTAPCNGMMRFVIKYWISFLSRVEKSFPKGASRMDSLPGGTS